MFLFVPSVLRGNFFAFSNIPTSLSLFSRIPHNVISRCVYFTPRSYDSICGLLLTNPFVVGDILVKDDGFRILPNFRDATRLPALARRCIVRVSQEDGCLRFPFFLFVVLFLPLLGLFAYSQSVPSISSCLIPSDIR